MPIAYKVVNKHRDSVIMSNTGFNVHYPKHTKIYAPSTYDNSTLEFGLFVFDTYQHALALHHDDSLILRVGVPRSTYHVWRVPEVRRHVSGQFYILDAWRHTVPKGTMCTPWLYTFD